ncbi:MAG: hypothetical protein KAR87_01775 [Candidatus Aenigmarchaeota archaeon]|nr:hypothetical protein [Candidatus Aenigmarchaeota archaeon]
MTNKEHISITLDENLIRWLDKRVNGYSIKNRSHAIEKLLLKAMNEECLNQAVILCGGNKDETPKAMTLIDKKPALEHTIEYLKKQDITDIILIVNYNYDKIISYFGKGTKYDINIRYIIEDEPLGTVGFLKSAKGMINNTFMLLYGDILFNVDVNDMLKVHRNHKATVTMALTTSTDTSSYGVVKLKGEKITKFIEKPSAEESPSHLINAGLFIIEPRLLELLPHEDNKIMLENIFTNLCNEGKLAGYVYDGRWTHIGNGNGGN